MHELIDEANNGISAQNIDCALPSSSPACVLPYASDIESKVSSPAPSSKFRQIVCLPCRIGRRIGNAFALSSA